MSELISKRVVGCATVAIAMVVQMFSTSMASMAYSTEGGTEYCEEVGCLCDEYHLSGDDIYDCSVVNEEDIRIETEITEGDSITDSTLVSTMLKH